MKRNIRVLKLFMLLLIVGLPLVFLSACDREKDSDNGKLKVAVTIEVERAFVEAVAGDLVDIVTLVPKGGSPETFEASPVEIEKFKESDIFFALELPVENSKNVPVDGDFKTVSLADAARVEYKDREFAPGSRDHHSWLSPKRVMLMVEKIAEVLIAEDPLNEEVYLANKTAYLEELSELDDKIVDILDVKDRNTFLIFHPALGYFADDYGLNMLAFEEEGKEADPKRIGELIDLAKSEGIKGILTTEEISAKQVEAFAEEIGGEVVVVEVLSSDYVGAMENIAREIARLL